MMHSNYPKAWANEANDKKCEVIYQLIKEASNEGKYNIIVDVDTVDLNAGKIIYLEQSCGYNIVVADSKGPKYRISW